MTIAERIRDFLRPPVQTKAATGIGAVMMTYGTPLSLFTKDPRKAMQQAQALGISNLYIRACERVIGDRFSTVEWHLEDADDEDIEDTADQAYAAILRLLERPYVPQPGDPASATPQTRSGLWRVTCRHLGLTGNAFWYLDGADALAGTPLSLLSINPSRMTPAEDKAGNLLGWVLDADVMGKGVPIEREQVLHFMLEPPDTGHYGIGLVESAMSRAELMRLTEQHASGVLAAGGRMAGIFSPPAAAGAIPEDQFEQLVKDVRTIAEAPDAARRALVLRGPIEYERTAATPTEMQLEALSLLGRDGILHLWGVPLSQLGGNTSSGGLNSGETRKYDEAVLWQNAVGPRLRSFAETLQFGLLDRFATLGKPVELEIEEPEFDDDAPMYALAAQATSLPLTNAERRAIIGLEPTGDETFDSAVWVPISLTEVWTVGTGKPEPPPMPPQFAPAEPAGWASARRFGDHHRVRLARLNRPYPSADEEVKARAIPGVDRVRQKMTAGLRSDMAAILRDMAADIAAKVRRNAGHLKRKPTDDAVWWDEAKWERRLLEALRPQAALAAEATHDRTVKLMGAPAKAQAELRDIVLARILGDVGFRIKGILRTTREKVRSTIEQGIADGLGAAELGDLIEKSAGFDEYRAEVIARTETNRVLNFSQVESFREFGVQLVEAIDGDDDEECRNRQARDSGHGPGVYTVDEAAAIEDHPNGTLDWSPLVLTAEPVKAAPVSPVINLTVHNHPPGVDVYENIHQAPSIINVQPTAVPVNVENRVEPTPINVTVDNHVEPTPVNVAAPDVTVNATVEGKADLPQSVYVVNMPEPKRVVIERDRAGHVTGARQE